MPASDIAILIVAIMLEEISDASDENSLCCGIRVSIYGVKVVTLTAINDKSFE